MLNEFFNGAAPGGEAGYTIQRSLRFNSEDSAHLSRTPSSAGNRKTWTWSGWVKRSELGREQALLSCGNSTNNNTFGQIIFAASDYLSFNAYGTSWRTTTQVFRDPSAWYHIVLAFDTTQATESDRVKLYVNGSEVTEFRTNNAPAQNTDYAINQNIRHTIGRYDLGGGGNYLSAYLADVHFIDGQALAATDFGEFDDNGVWQPKAYSGTYGTNGFHLDFSDNSSNAALGDDSSGNNNDWTVNNLVGSTVVYRNQVSVSGSYNSSTQQADKLFDGRLDTLCLPSEPSSVVTWTPSDLGSVSSLEIYGGGNSGSTTFLVSVNGSSVANNDILGSGGSAQWRTIPSSYYSGGLTTLSWGRAPNQGINMAAIRVNGIELIDSDFTDSLVDSPTNGTQTDTGAGGEVVGNYATLNPLAIDPVYALPTLSEGNLTAVTSGPGSFATITLGLASGKYYWEFTCGSSVSSGSTSRPASGFNEAREVNSTAFAWRQNGNTMGLNGSPKFSTYQTGDTIGIALDINNTQVTFYKNGVQQGSGAYSYTNTDDIVYIGLFSADNGGTYHYNFGQRPFAYTAPSGFKALCTTNLPDPTIADGSTAMDVVTYTGNGSTQTISGLGFSPDLVWMKMRSTAGYSHKLVDQVRGATKSLASNNTNAEQTEASGLTAFTSDGFSLGSQEPYNRSSDTFVVWAWDGGTSTATNTDGSITSTVRANASAGFSIVSWTGTGSAGSIGHGLNTAPALYIIKNRDSSSNWVVKTTIVDGSLDYLYLNLTNVKANSSVTAPTNSVINLGVGITDENASGADYITYCFAPVDGYSSFGSYVGNGSSDGSFIYCGFRPRWIMVKASSLSRSWYVFDTARDTYNAAAARLVLNTSSAESTSQPEFDLVSNGFKLRGTDAAWNGSGSTYIYAAFAENPFKYARAR